MNETCNFVINRFNTAGYECYLVGGAVRDMVMGKEPKDLDFATNARPDEIIELMRGKKVGFATILVGVNGEKVEISTYRKREKYYADSRIPEVEFGDTILEDLARRDFTINAMAILKIELKLSVAPISIPSCELIDPYGGERDIKNKIIRLTNNDESVLIDDPLRMLRAVRFISKLGFNLDSDLCVMIKRNSYKVLYVSRERWLMEMDKILTGSYVKDALEEIIVSGIYEYILPEWGAILSMDQGKPYHHKNVSQHILKVVANCPGRKNLRWAALSHDLGKGATRSIDEKGNVHFYKHEMVSAKLANDICDRFKMSNRDRKEIVFLVANHMRIMNYNSKWKDSAVRRFVLNAGEYLDNMFALSRADITSLNPKVVEGFLRDVAGFKERIANLREEGKVEPRLIGREKFKELVEFSELSGNDIGIMKGIVEQGIADGEIEEDYLVEDLYNYCRERIEFRRI